MSLTLEAARVNRKLSRQQAAELIGVSYDTISNWENEVTSPSAYMVKPICEAYGCAFDDLIFPCPKKTDKS